jgi:cobalt-zinc-cadmium efflux system protein
MGHDHAHGHGQNRRRLAIALALAATYMGAEIVGGLWTGSLALLADAGHMASDVASLALALGAMWLARRPATPTRTFGFQRAEILAALLNGAALVVIGVLIIVEAAERLEAPPEVLAGPMMAIAAGGLVVNIAALFVLSGGQGESLNVRGAFLHVVADTLGSVGALTSGVVIYFFDLRWVDPAVSFFIAALVIGSALLLLRNTARVLMQSAPPRLDMVAVRAHMQAVPGVLDVHDLHAWTLTSGRDLLSAHVVVEDLAAWPGVLAQLRERLHDEHALDHVTLQPEPNGGDGCGCSFGER